MKDVTTHTITIVYRTVVVAALVVLTSSCVVTRTSRPLIRGTVVNGVTNEPVAGVDIWNVSEIETKTAPDGTFVLPRRTYRETTFPGREAPPVLVEFRAVKEGYCTYRYKGFNRYGGGGAEATWDVDVTLEPARPDCDTSSNFLPHEPGNESD